MIDPSEAPTPLDNPGPPAPSDPPEAEAAAESGSAAPMVLAILALLLALVVGVAFYLHNQEAAAENLALAEQVKAQQEALDALTARFDPLEENLKSYEQLAGDVMGVQDTFQSYQQEAKDVLTNIVQVLDRIEYRQKSEVKKLRARIDKLLVAGEAADEELREIVRELETLNVKLRRTERQLKQERRGNFEVNVTRANALVEERVWTDSRFIRCSRAVLRKAKMEAAEVDLAVVTDATVQNLVELRFAGARAVELELGSSMGEGLTACIDNAMKRNQPPLPEPAEGEEPAETLSYELVKRISLPQR